MKKRQQIVERIKCSKSLPYFVNTYCMIEEPSPLITDNWIPFRLWPFQKRVLGNIKHETLIAILKARQLGLSWLVMAYALWLMLFHPGSVILIFSAGDVEAKNILNRLRNMHQHLPPWLQAAVTVDNDHNLAFGTIESRAQCFASTKKSGRSFTGTLVIVDEADWIIWFKEIMNSVKPTIDNGGQLILISTSDKARPNSEFKQIWKKAWEKLNSYFAVFLPWHVHPNRDEAWYEQTKANTPDIDDLYQEYPTTPAEALAGRSSNKRFRPEWIMKVDGRDDPHEDAPEDLDRLGIPELPAIPGLTIYHHPNPGWRYLIAIDTCEGDPTSDPSPMIVYCEDTWEEVAHVQITSEPTTLADYAIQLSTYYFNATLVPERNNHGHAFNAAVALAGHQDRLYQNPHDNKFGWLSNQKFKTLAVNNAANIMQQGACRFRSDSILIELANFEASTLAAPEGDTDDNAMAAIIGLAALTWPTAQPEPGEGYTIRAR